MKYLYYLSAIALLLSVGKQSAVAQGWPANYDGVMLQGFYWDSYTDSKWTKLESQADELSQYFSLIWVPQSGKASGTPSMGYDPKYYFYQNSSFGTEAELRSMISTFKKKGLGTIADVVINHRANVSSWVDFPRETYKGVTYEMVSTDICKNDDGGATQNANPSVTLSSNYDEGEDWSGMRDLDHKSTNVQNCIKAYEDYLVNDLGYTGFRYDMMKGFSGSHIGMYNSEAKVQYSVGEYWDGNTSNLKKWINNTKYDANGNASTEIQSGAFDFAGYYNIKNAFGSTNWSSLSNASLAKDADYSRYAVTFVDNHDTGTPGKDDADPLTKNIEAANAYILAMPGTPCVFMLHWQNYKTTIKKLIALRKLVGITNQSTVTTQGTLDGGYYIGVRGTNGIALVFLGSAFDSGLASTCKLALSGNNFKYYVTNNIDIASLDTIKEEEKEAFTVPSCCVVNEGETCAFFEAPSSWTGTIKCWCWGSTNYTGGTWPGQACTLVGTSSEDKKIYKWTYTGTATVNATGIIFSNNGSPQTKDLDFVNGGYYTEDGYQATVSAAKKGDVNGDGYVNISDVNAIIAVMCGTTTNSKADVNGDGNVNISDVNAVIAIMCGN